MKEFFKPSIIKIILFIILFILGLAYSGRVYGAIGGPSNIGYPFKFFQSGSCYGPIESEFRNCWDTEITSYFGLIADIVIWYLASCLIVFIINKFKK